MFSNSDGKLFLVLVVLGLAGVLGAVGCVRRDTDSLPAEPALAGYTDVDLKHLAAAPQDFLHRKVRFEAYFASKSDLYLPFHTQFTTADYINFTLWPAGARLWLRGDMESSLSSFYIPRDGGEIIEKNPERLIEKLDAMRRFQPVVVYGTVASIHDDTAWVIADAFRFPRTTAYSAQSILRMQLATERYEQKQFDLAAKDFAAALALGVPPEVEGGVRRSMGLSLLASEDYSGAVGALSAAKAMGADDQAVSVGLAEAQIELGRFADAEKNARDALAKSPRSVLGRSHLAVALGSQGKTDAALDECADALKLFPGDADVLRAQGIVLDLAGKDRLDEAIESYRQAVLARATDPRIQRELGQLYLKKGEFSKAKEYFENVMNLSKGNASNYCQGCCLLAEACQGLKKPEDAVNAYLLAQKRDKKYIPAYMGLGSLYAEGAREKEAIEQFMVVAKKLDPDGENGFQAWKRCALFYRTKPENMAKAAECYEQAVAIKPSDWPTWLDLASARWEQPKPDRAAVEMALRRAGEAGPQELAPRYRLGVLLTEMGNTLGAVAEFEAAKARAPKDVATLLRLGQGYRRLGRDEEALREFETAIALDSANLDVKNSLAYVLADIGGKDALGRAEKLATETVEAKPGEAAYQDTLGWVLVKQGRSKDALVSLEKAANASNDADVLYHLGCAYAAEKQWDKALEKLTAVEVKLRQGKLSCKSCQRLQESAARLLAQVKKDKARAEAAAAAAVKAPPPPSKKPDGKQQPVKSKK